MRRMLRILGLAMVVVAILATAIAGTVFADNSGPLGPNPDAGDGIPDGSSLDAPNGPNGDMVGLELDSKSLR
ncbi:hypothetical protein ACFLX7_04440 [Chloroflexota bacterium]